MTSPAPRSTPTIAEIARQVGVSVPTVSKVLNGRDDVAEDTRARVEEAVERHGYRRRRRTARPRAGTGLVDLVFHRLGSSWSMELVRGVESAAARAGVSVILSELDGDHRPPRAWLDVTLARPPVGVILVASHLTAVQRRRLTSRSIPFAVIDTDGEPPQEVPSVGSDNWHGGLAATRHLLELDHRRIGAIGGPEDMLCSRARIDGYRSALADAGVAYDDGIVRAGNFEVASGYRAGCELLDLPDRPTAVFAGSDMQAVGLVRAAQERGLSLPRDLSIVGYDDLPLAQWTTPALTTVHQPIAEMAASAARMVLDLAAGVEPEARRINLATELVVRESTAPPPS